VQLSRFSSRVILVSILAAASGSVGLTGCASKPTMKLRAAEVSGVRLAFPPQLGVVMNLVLDVRNPNAYDVAIRAVRGNAVLAGRYTLPIEFQPGGEGIWLGADAVTTIRVPVTIPIDLGFALLRESFAAPTVPYRVVGSADVTASRTFKVEKDNYAFDEEGSFTRQQLEVALPRL